MTENPNAMDVEDWHEIEQDKEKWWDFVVTAKFLSMARKKESLH